MRKLWLTFAQTVTIALALLFVARLFYPQLMASQDKTIVLNEVQSSLPGKTVGSYSKAASKAMPAVVNIFTSKFIQLFFCNMSERRMTKIMC